MKTRKPSTHQLSLPLASAIALLLATAAQATDFFWDGANGNWATASDWSTTDAGTSNPGASPNSITTADLFFNITSKNAASSFISNGGGGRNALSLTFNSSGATNMRAGGNSSAASTLTIGAGGVTLGVSSGNVTLGQTPSSFGILNVALGADQTWTNNATNALTVTGAISGASRKLTKSGTGKILLTGSNIYSGNTTVSGGVLQLGSANALPGGIASAGGTSLLILNGGVVGLGEGDFSRTMGSTAANFQFTLSGGGFAAYGGDRNVTPGTLAFGSTVGTNILGTLKLSAADSDSTTAWTSNISFAGSARTVEIANGSAAIDAKFSGQLSGGGSSGLNKAGSGTLALTNNTNSYTGDTTVTLGTLMLGDGTANTGKLGATAAISLATGATLAVNRTGATTQATDLNGKVISGAGAFSQVGSGTTILSLANTYTGTTAVNAGTLVMGDDVTDTFTTSAVTVASNAILAGAGTIQGTVELAGILAPGVAGVNNDIGTLTVGSDTTWIGAASRDAATIWQFDLSAISNASDGFSIIGDFKKDSTVGTVYEFDFMNSAPVVSGNIYTLVTWTGVSQFTNADEFTWSNLGGDYELQPGTGFTLNSNSLTFTAVPEPTTGALTGLLLGACLLRRCRLG
jgi:autotransporter-associated beta strand protein